MNYSELNDYQINNLVHNIIVCGGKYTLVFSGEHDIQWIDKSDGLVAKTGKQSYGTQLKNYCNSWADAGPIILSCKLWLREMFGTWQARGFPGKPHSHNQVGWSDENPLRAAMIVFLMMQEAK